MLRTQSLSDALLWSCPLCGTMCGILLRTHPLFDNLLRTSPLCGLLLRTLVVCCPVEGQPPYE